MVREMYAAGIPHDLKYPHAANGLYDGEMNGIEEKLIISNSRDTFAVKGAEGVAHVIGVEGDVHDALLKEYIEEKVAVFCDSEFWHGKDWEVGNARIKTNRDFWIPKIERNIQRDIEVNEALEAEGWIVLRFWGEEILKNVEGCADAVEETLRARKGEPAHEPGAP